MLKISIITPSYNSRLFIKEALDSVIGQNYPNTELIVVDNASTDGTVEVLKQYNSYLRYISEPDKGGTDAFNKGIKLATGDILGFLCSDDIYTNYALEKVASYFNRNPDAQWLIGKCAVINSRGMEIRKPITLYKNWCLAHYSYTWLLVSDFIPEPAVFIRKEAVEEIGAFETVDITDYDYWLRIGSRYKPGIIDDYLACYRLSGNCLSSKHYTKYAKRALETAQGYAKKNNKHFLLPLQYLNYLTVVSVYTTLRRLNNDHSR